jgi:hypothetical protein
MVEKLFCLLSLCSYFFLYELFCATFSIFLNVCTLILAVKRNNLDIPWLRKVKTKYFKTFFYNVYYVCLEFHGLDIVHVCMTYKNLAVFSFSYHILRLFLAIFICLLKFLAYSPLIISEDKVLVTCIVFIHNIVADVVPSSLRVLLQQ